MGTSAWAQGSIDGKDYSASPLASSSAVSGGFTPLPASRTGVEFVSPLEVDHPKNFLYHSGFATGGVCIGDLNGDSRPDLFFANGPASNQLYLQLSNEALQFSAVPASTGIGGGTAWSAGAALVDIDSDGDLDIYVCNYDQPNHLFINQTTDPLRPQFKEAARDYGLALIDACLMPAFADADRDGDLDLYVLNNQFYRPGGRPNSPPFRMVNGKPVVLPEFAKYYGLREAAPGQFTMDTYGRPDRFFRNEGRNAHGQIQFTDVTEAAGISGTGHGLSVTWWDYNGDLYPDIYIGNDFTDPDRLYRNNQDGTFTEVIKDTFPYCTWSSMGATPADFNNDGYFDLFSADMAATTHFSQKVNMGDMSKHQWLMENGWPRQIMRNMLYINTGTERFMETAWMSGLAQSDWTWAAKAADFDNDGQSDLFLSTGMVRNFSDSDIPMDTSMLVGRTIWDLYKDTPPLPQKNLVFRNQGDLQFKQTPEWGLNQESISYGTASGDLDNDGDQDLVVVNLDAPVSIFRNDVSNYNQIVVRLQGTKSNSFGLGARVDITTDEGKQAGYLSPMTGFLSCNASELHFGLGKQSNVKRLTINWPSGYQQEFENLRSGFRYTFVERSQDLPPKIEPPTRSKFKNVTTQTGLRFTHRERPYDDFKRQPLLPAKLSQLGPGHAWGDANGDGNLELYVGGAAGQSGQMYTSDSRGRFRSVLGPWRSDATSEDMGCLWFDADADGDLDLYVGSGGVEGKPGDEVFRDRLYLNHGQLKFVKASDSLLPHGAHSTSIVAGSDIDGDNDIDLFIGSRSIPGKFPLAPKSYLLRNDSDQGYPRFTDITSEWAPDLQQVGLVTSALWSDTDQDGRDDLLVALEWGSLHIFRNQGDRLTNQTEATKLAERTGWWNSLTGADLDQDGDIDYLAMNVGLNTKYGTASVKKPAYLYYGDMDGTGAPHLVEAKSISNEILPIRGRSCSANAMPMLSGKFPTFRSFASADLLDIYTPNRVQHATRFAATTFESGILINESSPDEIRFQWLALPRQAQTSPGYGLTCVDVDGDQLNDIFVVGNNDTREPETSLWRGMPGILLAGKGNNTFEVEPYTSSGLLTPNDTKSLSVVDWNKDSRPDFLAAENNGQLLAFENQSLSRSYLSVTLNGPRGNPNGIGSRVSVRLNNGKNLVGEIYAGSGYLTQNAPTLFFGLADDQAETVRVEWPDGRISQRSVQHQPLNRIQVTYPSN